MKVDDHRIRFLNSLERAESKLLAWGLVDGSFNSDEIAELCEAFLEENGSWDKYDDEEQFQEALEDFMGEDLSEFFDDYVFGTKRTPKRPIQKLSLLHPCFE